MNADPKRREGTLARIRALMAKTVDNGCTEAEAAEAARKVDELMALYEIDLDEVSMRKQEMRQAAAAKAAKHPVEYAAHAIAKFTDTICWKAANGDLVYFGFQVDAEIAEYLTLLFRRAIDRETGAFTLFNHDYDAAKKHEQHEMIRSFGQGMAIRLGERLRELKSKRDFSQREAGNALVLMKRPAVEKALAELGIVLGKAGEWRKPLNEAAAEAGRTAAEHVAINQGIAQRAQRQDGRLV